MGRIALGAALTASGVTGTLARRAVDACAKIGGAVVCRPGSFPYNATLAKSVMDVKGGGLGYHCNTMVNLDFEFARIRKTKYNTDYEFNRDLYNVVNRLDDGHTLCVPRCYRNALQNILPAPVVALEKNGAQDIYITPDAVEFLSLIGPNLMSYYDQRGFNWKKYAGAKVLTIEGLPAWAYVNLIATTRSGVWVDHNIRRLGDLAASLFPDKHSLTMTVIPSSAGAKPEIVKFEYHANYLGAPFTDGPSYWTAICVAKSITDGVDNRRTQGAAKKISRPKLRPMATTIDGGAPEGIVLSDPYLLTLPIAYILAYNKTEVVRNYSMDPRRSLNWSFQVMVVGALANFESVGVQQLIVDTTGNGGGYVCLGEFLINALAGTSFGYS
ncbi:hypothetical protein FRC11_000919 [Ceratobasidium sp. 423]|nr:hypothetical protein FRC11_000919 [Ceratobasidium sp. 423]